MRSIVFLPVRRSVHHVGCLISALAVKVIRSQTEEKQSFKSCRLFKSNSNLNSRSDLVFKINTEPIMETERRRAARGNNRGVSHHDI